MTRNARWIVLAFAWICVWAASPAELTPSVIVVDETCLLVDAIDAANLDVAVGGCPAGAPGHDEILLTADVELVAPHEAENGTPPIASPVTIDGGGFAISRDSSLSFRLLQVGTAERDGHLLLRNTTISGGFAHSGGGILLTRGEVTLLDSVVSDNLGCYGGGLFLSRSRAQILRSSIVDNIISKLAACNYFDPQPSGGGVFSGRDIEEILIVDSTISGNFGDASYFYPAHGAGLKLQGRALLAGSLVADNTTEAGCRTDALGAGLDFTGFDDEELTIVNSTISGNQGLRSPYFGCSGQEGHSVVITGTATITNTTITGHAKALDLGYDPVTLKNSILSNTSNCDGKREIVDSGGNLDDHPDSICDFGGTLVGLDPLLTDNGGPTLTHGLLPESNAIDIDPTCSLLPDQRGFVRDGSCDSGAAELGAVDPSFELEVSGQCPGRVTATASGATPGSTVQFFLSTFRWPHVPRVRDCPGTIAEIGGTGFRLEATADGRGFATASRTLTAERCGAFVEAFDPTTCAMSEVQLVPPSSTAR